MALTDAKIRAAKPDEKPYKLADSGSMFLLVPPNGSRYWRLRYRHLGKEKTLALGSIPKFHCRKRVINVMRPENLYLTVITRTITQVSVIYFSVSQDIRWQHITLLSCGHTGNRLLPASLTDQALSIWPHTGAGKAGGSPLSAP